jgi:hypothetical protein
MVRSTAESVSAVALSAPQSMRSGVNAANWRDRYRSGNLLGNWRVPTPCPCWASADRHRSFNHETRPLRKLTITRYFSGSSPPGLVNRRSTVLSCSHQSRKYGRIARAKWVQLADGDASSLSTPTLVCLRTAGISRQLAPSSPAPVVSNIEYCAHSGDESRQTGRGLERCLGNSCQTNDHQGRSHCGSQ